MVKILLVLAWNYIVKLTGTIIMHFCWPRLSTTPMALAPLARVSAKLDSWTDVWTGFWTDKATDDDHFQPCSC